ncbi:lantibiotic nisin-A [Paenibacillus sp. NRS-1775]|uniref:gallidermin/nisin family lantibiotic n=1 Tax=unclassified Paenibacillus TaxID=185978 RepID=UPI003D27E6E0
MGKFDDFDLDIVSVSKQSAFIQPQAATDRCTFGCLTGALLCPSIKPSTLSCPCPVTLSCR